jgi:hypothetical protein
VGRTVASSNTHPNSSGRYTATIINRKVYRSITLGQRAKKRFEVKVEVIMEYLKRRETPYVITKDVEIAPDPWLVSKGKGLLRPKGKGLAAIGVGTPRVAKGEEETWITVNSALRMSVPQATMHALQAEADVLGTKSASEVPPVHDENRVDSEGESPEFAWLGPDQAPIE